MLHWSFLVFFNLVEAFPPFGHRILRVQLVLYAGGNWIDFLLQQSLPNFNFLLDMSQPCGTWIEGSGHSLDVLRRHQVVYNVWNHLMVGKRLGCWSIINAQAGLIRAVDWPSLHGLLCGTHLMPSLGYGAQCTCNVSTWRCMKKEFLLILTFQLLGCNPLEFIVWKDEYQFWGMNVL